jgi:hypothetical protein
MVSEEGMTQVEKTETLSQKLARLMKEFEASGRTLTDASSKIKAIGFVGGVRKPGSLPDDVDDDAVSIDTSSQI